MFEKEKSIFSIILWSMQQTLLGAVVLLCSLKQSWSSYHEASRLPTIVKVKHTALECTNHVGTKIKE
jgi:hypothetical protein